MPGYAAALADYKRRVDGDSIRIAGTPSNNSDQDSGRRKSLLAALFSSGDENEQEVVEADAQMVAEAKPERKRRKDDDQQVVMAAAETEQKPEDDFTAPVPKVRPAFNNEDQLTIQTALLGRNKNPAEEAMQAALSPQPADEAKADEAKQDEFADLAAYRVPVPELLGSRKRPGDGQDELMTASLDSSDVAELATVPVPDERPEAPVDQTVTASADTAGGIDVPAADVKPEEIAALAAQTDGDQADESTDEDEVAGMIDSLDNADADEKPASLAEMASLDVPKDTTMATRSLVLPADAADELDAAAAEPKAVVKGGRPKKAGLAQASNDEASTRVEPKLTKNLIAQWALTNGRVELLAKPVKAPRFVSKTIRKQPTEVYAAGFTQNTVQIDPARFSGTAVNFMAVKKFSDAN